jgi:hypothetical protein
MLYPFHIYVIRFELESLGKMIDAKHMLASTHCHTGGRKTISAAGNKEQI